MGETNRSALYLLLMLLLLGLLASCVCEPLASPSGQDPLEPAAPEADAPDNNSSAGLCSALPANLLLLGIAGVALGRRARQ